MKPSLPLLGWIVAAACTMCATAGLARADDPVDSSVDVQLFDLAIGPHAFLTVDGAEVLVPKAFHVGMMLQYLAEPLTIYDIDPATKEYLGVRSRVVESLFEGQIYGAYGLKDKLQIGVALPVTLSMTGEGLDMETGRAAAGGLSVTGLGDARVEVAYQFYRKGNLAITANPALTLPTSTSLGSQDNAWLGDDLPGFLPRAAAEWQDPNGKLSAAANLGFLARWPREVYSSRLSSQLLYGAAVRYRFTDKLGGVGELFGRKGLRGEVDELPMELGGAASVVISPTLTLLVGGGAGLIKGLGTPSYRLFGVVTWSRDYSDSDGDGIANANDRCPQLKEDVDGWEDSDGCPEADNDNDFIEDAADACPNQAEDKDGFDDEDGCPEPDNDKDGFLDGKDRCPTQAEDKKPPHPEDGCPASSRDSDGDGIQDDRDKCPSEEEDVDGFEDEDGCPEPDNDQDGVKDEDDRCPVEAEDKDNFEDSDGCPEDDNDKDGFLDSADKCPNEAEVINGLTDDDGCPDQGGKMLARFDGRRIVFTSEPKFGRGNTIGKTAKPHLEQAALHMRAHREVKTWRLVVATKKQRRAKDPRRYATERAVKIKAFLVERGISAESIEPMGAVSDRDRLGLVASEIEEAPAPGSDATEPAAGEPAADAADAPDPVFVDDAAIASATADNDNDGITGDDDKCPDQAETINGVKDEDGCPDQGGKVLATLEGKVIKLAEPVPFGSGKRIRSAGKAVLDQAAAHMRAHAEIKWRVVVAAKGGAKVAQSRADAVRDYLSGRGVTKNHIEALGVAGESDRVGIVAAGKTE